MIEHRNGILIAVALMVGVPAITLVATLHQMFGTGGEGPIRASACLLYTSDAADDLTRVDLG
ncbi:hypothetical protein PVA98_27825, partial [Achromobacter xylosoxidans]|nr:hypothetical protein [Achromobacter xylosoxidans]